MKPSVYDHSQLRSYLKAEYDSRVVANPRYSLRAFATRIGLAPSTLVEVIHGRKNLSIDRASSVAEGLQLTGPEKCYFLWLACLDNSRDPFFHDMIHEQIEYLRSQVSERNDSDAPPPESPSSPREGELPIS